MPIIAHEPTPYTTIQLTLPSALWQQFVTACQQGEPTYPLAQIQALLTEYVALTQTVPADRRIHTMSPNPVMVKAQIYLPRDLWAQFQSICKRRRTSASAVLRDAIGALVVQLEANPLLLEDLAMFEAFLTSTTPEERRRHDH